MTAARGALARRLDAKKNEPELRELPEAGSLVGPARRPVLPVDVERDELVTSLQLYLDDRLG